MNTRNSHIRERVDVNPISACGFTPPLPLLLLTHLLINIYIDTNIIQKQLIIGYINLSWNWKPCLLKCNCSLTSVHFTPYFLFNSTFSLKLVEKKHQAFPRTPWTSKLVKNVGGVIITKTLGILPIQWTLGDTPAREQVRQTCWCQRPRSSFPLHSAPTTFTLNH